MWNRSAYSSECEGMCCRNFVRGFLLTSGYSLRTLSSVLDFMTFLFYRDLVTSGTITDECAEAGFVELVRLCILIEVGSLTWFGIKNFYCDGCCLLNCFLG